MGPRVIRKTSVTSVDKKTRNTSVKKEAEPIPFLVNRNGFPIDGDTWERMWQFAAIQYMDRKDKIFATRHAVTLPQVDVPVAPLGKKNSADYVNVWEYTMSVQDYLEKLQYNHTGTQFFEIKKNRPLNALMDTAKSMTTECLPIKCLESVILSIYLTNGLPCTERFPINFKSKFCGRNYYHVVLGIFYADVYGTLGLSRRSDLMYKPLLHKKLSELIFDFIKCYRRYHHRVIKVTVGSYVPHEPKETDRVTWKGLCLHMTHLNEETCRREIDKFARLMRNNALPEGPIVLPPQGLVKHLSRQPSRPVPSESPVNLSMDLVNNLIEENDLPGLHSFKLRI